MRANSTETVNEWGGVNKKKSSRTSYQYRCQGPIGPDKTSRRMRMGLFTASAINKAVAVVITPRADSTGRKGQAACLKIIHVPSTTGFYRFRTESQPIPSISLSTNPSNHLKAMRPLLSRPNSSCRMRDGLLSPSLSCVPVIAGVLTARQTSVF